MQPIIVQGLFLTFSIYALIKSSYYVVRYLMSLSKQLKISLFIVSFIFLSVSTSLAELSVGISAAIANNPELSLGDVLGTNIVNLTLILGLLALISGKLKLSDYKQFRQDSPFIIFAILLPFVLLIDGTISRVDGLVLLGAFTIHTVVLLNRAQELSKKSSLKHSIIEKVPYGHLNKEKLVRSIVFFMFSVLFLLAAAFGTVTSITNIAEMLGVPEFIMGLFVVAIGTSLPELTVGLRSVLGKKSAISIGNLFGAATINVTLVLGIVALIKPIEITQMPLVLATGGATIAILAVSMISLGNGKHYLSRKIGLLLIFIYVAVVISQLLLFGGAH